MEENKSASLGYVPALDGLRAISILLVIGHHSPVRHFFPFNHGWVGVDVFFVLSGYLITTLLLRERNRNGKIDLKQFYWRRFLRIVPAFWVWILIIYLSKAEPPEYLLFLILYVSNLAMAFGYMSSEGPGAVTWSLSVEEQFYLCWPPLIKILSPPRILWAALWAILAFTLWRIILIQIGINGFPRLYARPDGRMDVILWGCAAALIEDQSWFGTLKPMIRAARHFLLAALVLFGFASFRLSELGGGYTGQLGFMINAVVTAGIILWIRSCPKALATRILGVPLMSGLGKLSYSMYLWHYVVPGWFFSNLATMALDTLPPSVTAANPRWLYWGAGAILWMGLIIVPSLISYFLIERPFLRLKARFPGRSPINRLHSAQPESSL